MIVITNTFVYFNPLKCKIKAETSDVYFDWALCSLVRVIMNSFCSPELLLLYMYMLEFAPYYLCFIILLSSISFFFCINPGEPVPCFIKEVYSFHTRVLVCSSGCSVRQVSLLWIEISLDLDVQVDALLPVGVMRAVVVMCSDKTACHFLISDENRSPKSTMEGAPSIC